MSSRAVDTSGRRGRPKGVYSLLRPAPPPPVFATAAPSAPVLLPRFAAALPLLFAPVLPPVIPPVLPSALPRPRPALPRLLAPPLPPAFFRIVSPTLPPRIPRRREGCLGAGAPAGLLRVGIVRSRCLCRRRSLVPRPAQRAETTRAPFPSAREHPCGGCRSTGNLTTFTIQSPDDMSIRVSPRAF